MVEVVHNHHESGVDRSSPKRRVLTMVLAGMMAVVAACNRKGGTSFPAAKTSAGAPELSKLEEDDSQKMSTASGGILEIPPKIPASQMDKKDNTEKVIPRTFSVPDRITTLIATDIGDLTPSEAKELSNFDFQVFHLAHSGEYEGKEREKALKTWGEVSDRQRKEWDIQSKGWKRALDTLTEKSPGIYPGNRLEEAPWNPYQ